MSDAEPKFSCIECVTAAAKDPAGLTLTAGWGTYLKLQSNYPDDGPDWYDHLDDDDSPPVVNVTSDPALAVTLPRDVETKGIDPSCDTHLKIKRDQQLVSDREELTKSIEGFVGRVFELHGRQAAESFKGTIQELCGEDHDDHTFMETLQTILARRGMVAASALSMTAGEGSERSSTLTVGEGVSMLRTRGAACANKSRRSLRPVRTVCGYRCGCSTPITSFLREA